MEAYQPSVTDSESQLPGILAVGFGTTVSMWAIGYAGRLPAIMLPSPLILLLLLCCMVGGGAVLGRLAHAGWFQGAAAGAVSGTLNLLVLGSFLQTGSAAIAWVPGSVLLAASLGALGVWLGSFWRRTPVYSEWVEGFSRVAIAAALLLLAIGGLVTSTEAGLAVVDWPNSFGYNMFLYPFSRMTGGIYYEHAHRLFGALVGLTTLALALLLQVRESRRWVRRVGWFAFALVVVQGALGGLRVTGHFTMSEDPSIMRPSLILAMVHGIVGQIFFATLVAIGAFTSAAWQRDRQSVRPSALGDRRLAAVLILVMIGQLVLGAAQRHLNAMLMVHIVFGVAIVAPLAVHVGFRTWALNRDVARLRRLGIVLLAAIGIQIVLGLAAFVVTGAAAFDPLASPLAAMLPTAHQWFAAVLLGLATLLFCWGFRPARESTTDPGPR